LNGHQLATKGLVIRPMTLNDITTILEIERIAYPTPWTRQGYEREITHNELAQYHVLEWVRTPDAPAIVGYAGHWVMADEMHISMIAVHPTWQRNRLGELLLTHELVQACEKKLSMVTLEVREHNAPAQRLYQKLGFVAVGRRKNYYKDTKEAAILMTLEPLDHAAIQARWQQVVTLDLQQFRC
jgi:ribosomal-protein-alanine N-acetyltransferase